MIKAFTLWNKHFLEIIKSKRKTNTAPGLHQFMLLHARFFLEFSTHMGHPMEITDGYSRVWSGATDVLYSLAFPSHAEEINKSFFGIWIVPQRRTIKSLQAPRFRPCHAEGKFFGIQDFPVCKELCGCSRTLKISIIYLPAPRSSVWYDEQIPKCLFATGYFVAVYKGKINVTQVLVLWADLLLCSQTCRKCKANMNSPAGNPNCFTIWICIFFKTAVFRKKMWDLWKNFTNRYSLEEEN